MTEEMQDLRITIINKITTLNSILDEEHMNVLSGAVSYHAWRQTNSRILKHYSVYVRSARRLYNSGNLTEPEFYEFYRRVRLERTLAKQRTDAVRKIMESRIAYKK